MEQIATVIDNSQAGLVTVEVEIKSACGHCSNESSCGSQSIAKAFSKKCQQLTIPCKEIYPVGDSLKLGLPESVLLQSAALIYLLPLFGVLLGGFISQSLGANLAFGSDFILMLSSIAGGSLFWLWGQKLAKKIELKSELIILAHIGAKVIS